MQEHYFSLFHIKKIHYFSGAFLSLFIIFHLANHLFSLLGPLVHIDVMNQLRQIYQHPIIESLLLFSVILQVSTGIKLLFGNRKKLVINKVQVYSGLYLSMFLIAHVGAVMYGRYLNLDTNFYFASAGMNIFPACLVFIPYYFLAIMAITLHVASFFYLRKMPVKISVSIAVIGIVVSISIIVGYTDFFKWRSVPVEYRQFIELFYKF